MFDMRGRKMPKHNPSVVKKDKEASQRFTHQAKHFWGRIPEEIRRALLDNVWCGKSSHREPLSFQRQPHVQGTAHPYQFPL